MFEPSDIRRCWVRIFGSSESGSPAPALLVFAAEADQMLSRMLTATIRE